MKTASTAMKAHLAGGQIKLAYLWKVKRADSTILGFTNHDRDIDFDAGDGDGSVTYKASTGFVNSAASSKSDLSVDNLEAVGFLNSAAISEDDLRAGFYDEADIKLMLVNWTDLTMGAVILRRGTLGIVKMQGGQFTAELRGLSYKLTTRLGENLGPICRAEFGSGLNGIDMNAKYLCKVDVTLYRQTGSINNALGNISTRRQLFITNLAMVGTPTPTVQAPDGWFADGIITFTSGANAGLSFEIKQYSIGPSTVGLYLPMPFDPVFGDEFSIDPGCNKTTGDCTNKYHNIDNFRGEPFIPGMDRFMNVPGAGSGLG